MDDLTLLIISTLLSLLTSILGGFIANYYFANYYNKK